MGQINSSEGLLALDHNTPKVHLGGFCDEKFIPVKQHLEKMLKSGADQEYRASKRSYLPFICFKNRELFHGLKTHNS